ncbi:MAG: hypothetical protein ABW186_18440 [Rhodanobacteraceae bacterium]
MRSTILLSAAIAFATRATADEVTIQNDSLAGGDSGTIEAGFVAGEKAAAWLTSPCDGNLVAAQVFWTSLNGGSGETIEDSIDIYRAGTFPEPGGLAQQIVGPVLDDGFMNEFRYLDADNTIPLSVPVATNETVVVALGFLTAPNPALGPSVVTDGDGIHTGRNAIYASDGIGGFAWVASESFLVPGDWVVRAVVDCSSSTTDADVGVTLATTPASYTAGEPLTYTITVTNAGPANALSTTIVDAFPGAFTGASWTCAASGGATCAAGGSGPVLTEVIGLPTGASVVYTVDGTIATGTTATLTNAATAVVGAPSTDPDTTNNTASIDTDPAALDDAIFANGFDPPA